MQLTSDDYVLLEGSYITPEIARAAGLYRVHSIEGRELVARSGAGDFSAVVFPIFLPGEKNVLGYRIRLDHPPVDLKSGKAQYRYLAAPGQRNHIYCPLADPAWLADTTLPIVITEGEKKGLALHRAALEGQAARGSNGGGKPLFFAFAIAGVWGWRGVVGIATDAQGQRVSEKGVIPDFDRIVWVGRRVIICFDANVATNYKVAQARWALARELVARGARVYFLNLPGGPGINGVDDFLARKGLDAFLDLYDHAALYNWHDELERSDKGKIRGSFSNALIALRLAPEWSGVLAFNEFDVSTHLVAPPPFEAPLGRWADNQDCLLLEWFEQEGIRVSDNHAAKAAVTVAREHPYHPLREYLRSLKWDGIGRLDDWLTLYMSAEPTDYTRAVGAKWVISAVARAFEPGCQADYALILEGVQGTGKSTAFSILGGAFYSDDIAQLGTKDASLGTLGVWMIELSDLAAMTHAEVEKVKAFISRRIDRYRPPFARHYIWAPRQCIFGGTVNPTQYFKDETGARRFWPVACGRIRIAELRRDRDQLLAEAVARYDRGEHWFLETPELEKEAREEQEKRFQQDPWETLIQNWLDTQHWDALLSTADALQQAIHKESGHWTRADEMRVGQIFARLGWEVRKRPEAPGGKRTRLYGRKPER